MPIPVAAPTSDDDLYAGTAYVQIGDLRITQGQYVNGVVWNLEPIDGWDEPAGLTERVDQRSADHGGWLKPSYFTPRDLELKGTLSTPIADATGWPSLMAAWSQLKAAVPSFDEADLTVAQAGAPVLTAKVVQDSKPIIDQSNAVWPFSFTLIAADPRRYATDDEGGSTGLPLTTGGLSLPVVLPLVVGATTIAGLLTLTNDGDVATRPTMTVSGPCPPCTITHSSGRRLSVPDAVPAGRFLTLDVDSRTALLDGTTSRVVTGSWFDLDPGVNTIMFSSATYDASALLTVSYRSAWR